MRLRRLRCPNPLCPRRTFSEPLPEVAAPRARRSRRLQDVQRHLGLALGGAPAARLAHRLALPASPSTFLRMVRAGPMPVAPSPRVIAIDEWAWRRGRRYGMIIVDLERRAISSVLKRFAAGLQRDAAALANAIALPWSTGPAEGEISRLKTIKRQMYGRAGFELLRQRVLNTA